MITAKQSLPLYSVLEDNYFSWLLNFVTSGCYKSHELDQVSLFWGTVAQVSDVAHEPFVLNTFLFFLKWYKEINLKSSRDDIPLWRMVIHALPVKFHSKQASLSKISDFYIHGNSIKIYLVSTCESIQYETCAYYLISKSFLLKINVWLYRHFPSISRSPS